MNIVEFANKYYWISIIIFFLFGILAYIPISKIYHALIEKYKLITPNIKNYWKFIGIYFIIFIPLYLTAYLYSDINNRRDIISILNQLSTIILAISAGYFAFIQINIMRTDKLMQEAHYEIKEKYYDRAIEKFKQLITIDPNDFGNVACPMELYIFVKDWDNYCKFYPRLEQTIFNIDDTLIQLYIKTIYSIFRKRLEDAEKIIKKIITIKQECSKPFKRWDFTDLEKSEIYNKLEGDFKNILINLIKYIKSELTPEQTQKFESGNFLSTQSEEKNK